ncbi:MAG: tetraacyldisaccharide 4'-kinase [Phycisphaerales bacterium]|nr:tetraacyldisaccharide 4'-kinase [Phycisphaerales bacterium]
MAGLHWLGSWMMKSVVGMRNRRFDRGRNVSNVGVPVISVGNITVGGTGKTPVVQWIVRYLLASGHAPAIALRGYKAHKGVSDEAEEHRAALDGVPVLVGPRRVDTIKAALQRGVGLDCVVLDDGFQHRFVHRDLDIVLIDARRRPDQDRLLPGGRLREPARNLARADALIVTHADHADADLNACLTAVHGKPPLAACSHVWARLDRHTPEGTTTVEKDALDGMRIVTRFAVAGPQGLRDMATSHGATIVHDCPAKDHARPTARDLDSLANAAQGADAVLVSGKDWVVLEPLLVAHPLPCAVLVPQLELRFTHGEPELRNRIDSCLKDACT